MTYVKSRIKFNTFNTFNNVLPRTEKLPSMAISQRGMWSVSTTSIRIGSASNSIMIKTATWLLFGKKTGMPFKSKKAILKVKK